MIDRKGITDRVTLNGMTLMNWQIFNLPMDDKFITTLKQKSIDGRNGIYFKGNFIVENNDDSYLEMSNFKKGIVWINGHNLGRYWNIGPQRRLYCPGVWLIKGNNEVIVFDMFQQKSTSIKGLKTLE